MIIEFKRHVLKFGINFAYDTFLSKNGILFSIYCDFKKEFSALDSCFVKYIDDNTEVKIHHLSFALTYGLLYNHLEERIRNDN